MSDKKKVNKEIVRIPESKLINVIEKIVTEAVAENKKQWIAEQANKETDRISMLEGEIKKISKKLNSFTKK